MSSPGLRTRRPGLLRVGYAPGAFDLFHIGHLNLLRRARLSCDHLIAGVVSDQMALQQKGQLPVVPEQERLDIVASMEPVDEAILETHPDKLATWALLHFDVVFKGADWHGSARWVELERRFAEVGVQVVYLPYTRHVSTTLLRAEFARSGRDARPGRRTSQGPDVDRSPPPGD
jgi:glycerol-3-phosphate cytidylyltransferase